MPTPGDRCSWDEKLTRSGLFLAALLFHLILFLVVAGCIIFNPPPPPPDATPRGFTPPQAQVAVETPPRDTSAHAPVPDINANSSVNVAEITSHSPMSLPAVTIGLGAPGSGLPDPRAPKPVPSDVQGKAPREKLIRDFILTYQSLDDIEKGVLKAKFPVYVASYANGDWACNSRLDAEGKIVGGSMPDLAAKISEWSHGDIQAQVMPEPLNLSGSDLRDKKPPFIFFTGHKDFVLTDQEIANLRDYLQEGGLIWGDNALPGKGSRFDVAFRREMKRVVPDPDKNFVPMSLDDDIFAKSKFALAALPAGMNYYSEPLEHLDIDGKLAILYTPNDYSDLLYLRILPGDTAMGPTYNNRAWTSPLITSGTLWGNSATFFRNFTLPSALAVHRLGMNIVVHLLTRFNDDLLLSR